MPEPTGDELKSIFNGTLEGSLMHNEKQGIDLDLHSCIINASISLYESVKDILKASPTLGRQHYLFNMKTIISILQVIFDLLLIKY